MKQNRWTTWLSLIATGLMWLAGSSAMGQDAFGQDSFGQGGFGDALGGEDVFGGGVQFGAFGGSGQTPVNWSAEYEAADGRGRLMIEARLGRSWHIYSTTQPPGGPLRTKFAIRGPKGVEAVGKFEPDQPPAKSVSDVYPGVTLEEHEGVVVWTANFTLPPGFDDAIEVDVNALVCQSSGSCMPANETLTATFAGPMSSAAADAEADGKTDYAKVGVERLADPASKRTTFQDGSYEVVWSAGVTSSVRPGEIGLLVFRAQPGRGFHVYKSVVDDAESSTNFVITEKDGVKIGEPKTDRPIVTKSLFPSIPGVPDAEPVKFYNGEVTWTLPILVPKETEGGSYEVEGYIGYQACTDTSCLRPMAFRFVASVNVSDESVPTLREIEIESSRHAEAMDLASMTDWVDEIKADQAGDAQSNAAPESQPTDPTRRENTKPGSSGEAELALAAASPNGPDQNAGTTEASEASTIAFPLMLLIALGGGLILNLMPCVLPVVGLKIMSFVQQAGEDRRRVFSLNFAYVGGILLVFAGLTTLAVFFSFSWGQQFTYFPVRLGLTVTIFALALSYLGVWELPTPSLGSGEKSQELQDREGLPGAFFKGAFATILATPCSGPMLGVALSYTITLKPIETAILMMTVGVGMSLPYIILGLFPSLVGFLPKPGNWMVTLKEFLAFLFLGTVAFFFNQFSAGDKVPVFVTLIGVWFGCWVIGKVPPWEAIEKRARGWSFGIVSAVLIGWLSFAFLSKPPAAIATQAGGGQLIVDKHLEWEPYSEARLKELQGQGKTVMLDFTAAWCTNCFVNKKVALDTEQTSRLLERLDGVAMLADWTDQNEEIETKLQELNSRSIPVLAIYPGTAPDEPIVLRDLVSQSTVLNALEKAGPSQASDATATASLEAGDTDLSSVR
ncbi:MAG: protein-disulfide reductase DsbD domain-containing protein [Planctomycetota bacterium]